MSLESLRRRAKDIRLVITDMDGTLFTSDKSVTDYSVSVIRRLRDRGVSFTVATGRSYTWMGGFLDRIGIDGPLVASNGCEIVDHGRGERLFTASLSPENAEKGFDYIIKHHLYAFAETPEGWIVPDYVPDMFVFTGFHPELELNGYSDDKLFRINSGAETRGLTVLKILVWVIGGNEGPLMKSFADSLEGIHCLHSADNIYELLPEGASKDKSFIRMCDFMGISPGQCCAMGDFDNDMKMMEASGLSVAMANAPEYMRRAADYVTDTNNNDGVAKAIEKLFLEE